MEAPEEQETMPVNEEVAENSMQIETPETPQETAPESDSMQKLTVLVQRFMPDADTSTPEAVLTSLVPLVENIVAFHDDMNQVVEEVPEFADLLIYLRKGYSPQEAIAMSFDPESLTPPQGAPDYEGVLKAKEARMKSVTDRKTRMAQVEMNIDGSIKNIQAFATNNNWDEGKTMEFSDKVAGLFNDWADGKLTPESLEVLKKGFGYDNDVKTAYEDGMVAGKNAQIEKKRITKETGDGLPRMSNTGGVKETKPKDPFVAGLNQIASKKRVL